MSEDVGSFEKIETNLDEALKAHLAGDEDPEGRSPLHETIVVARESVERDIWEQAILSTIDKIDHSRQALWPGICLFIGLTEFNSEPLIERLEAALVKPETNAPARASIYSLLANLGRSISAKRLAQDSEVETEDPVRWLDLMIAATARVELKQKLILQAIERGHLGVDGIACRLEEVREAGGGRLGLWLRNLMNTFHGNEREELTGVLEGAFEGEVGAPWQRDRPKSPVRKFAERRSRTPARYQPLRAASGQ